MPMESMFRSEHDGLNISFAHQHADNARAVLVIVHGMAEHKERYYPFMRFLAVNGVASVIEDHRGHGKSVASLEELGYFGENGADGLISDIHSLAEYARLKYPDLPVFMLGHSMGALAVRAFIQQHGDMLDGLIVSGNPGDNPAAKAGVKMARRAQEKRGRLARCRLLTLGMLVPFILKSGKFYSRNGWVCSDRSVVEAYDSDPLCGFEFKANGYEALMTLMLRANDKAAPAPNKALPVRFFSGSIDACMGGEKALEAAAALLMNNGYEDVTVKLYPGLAHEILNEKERDMVYADMLAAMELWMME